MNEDGKNISSEAEEQTNNSDNAERTDNAPEHNTLREPSADEPRETTERTNDATDNGQSE